MTPRIGIALGDVTGIGPEVSLKAVRRALEEEDEVRYLFVGDFRLLKELNERIETKLPITAYEERDQTNRCAVLDMPVAGSSTALAQGCAPAARAAVAWLREGARRCLQGELNALVTAPVNKEAIVNAGEAFVGQTELLSQIAGESRTAMMLLGHDDRGRWLRVVLATTHVPLKKVSESLSQSKIELAIDLAARACVDLGLPRARVGVCGLNPHAGEGGHMGDEELVTIAPAVAAAKGRSINAIGPLSADALFYHAFKGEFDVVVAMYHDQGLAPLKMIAFESGVNWTLGLPFIRTSPDHGTAYDIAGLGKADAGSMAAAIELGKLLIARQ